MRFMKEKSGVVAPPFMKSALTSNRSGSDISKYTLAPFQHLSICDCSLNLVDKEY